MNSSVSSTSESSACRHVLHQRHIAVTNRPTMTAYSILSGPEFSHMQTGNPLTDHCHSCPDNPINHITGRVHGTCTGSMFGKSTSPYAGAWQRAQASPACL